MSFICSFEIYMFKAMSRTPILHILALAISLQHWNIVICGVGSLGKRLAQHLIQQECLSLAGHVCFSGVEDERVLTNS